MCVCVYIYIYIYLIFKFSVVLILHFIILIKSFFVLINTVVLVFLFQARIFSYLTIDDGELFPGRMACDHRGSMKKLMIGENLITQMSNYFDFLSRNAKNSDGIWTSPYLDAFGLGLMVTYAIPCISEVTGQ